MKDRNFLHELLTIYHNVPQHALWRAIEAKLLSEQNLERPILDVGCGDGTFSSVVFRNDKGGIYGCDASPDTVAKASLCGIYEEAVVADARKLPYPDAFFLSAFSNCVLEHIQEDEKVVSEISRVLKPGGIFIFTVPSEHFKANLSGKSNKEIEELDRRLEHYHYRTLDEWKEITERCGLRIEKSFCFISSRVLIKWESMMDFFTSDIMGHELGRLLTSKRFGINKLSSIILPRLFNSMLTKWYDEGLKETISGSMRFISAKKI